jgi:hypothetical protein
MSGRYIFPSPPDDFLPLSGGTVTGVTVFSAGVSGSTISGGTIYSGETNLENIFASKSVEDNFGFYLPLSGGTGGPYEFTGTTTASTIVLSGSITPTVDDVVNIGSPVKRFRSLYTRNGVATSFTASTIQLGNRTLNENNVVLTGDTIIAGSY